MFNPAEVGTICYFFGLKTAETAGELGDYWLEEDYIDHPSGDRLSVTEDKYVVNEQHEFNRDFTGLVLALQKLTEGYF